MAPTKQQLLYLHISYVISTKQPEWVNLNDSTAQPYPIKHGIAYQRPSPEIA